MTFSPNQMVREFMVKFERSVDISKPSERDVALCYDLIDEESWEVQGELTVSEKIEGYSTTRPNTDFNSERLTKELCDLIYVCCYTANKFGLPLEEAFKRVHESNMSKLDDNGKPLLREDGKILKSDNYKPANLGDLFV